MKNKICYSPRALEDLDEIWNYIVLELCNQDAAEQTVGRIMDAADNLKEFPHMGTCLSALIEVNNDYRFLVCGNYLIFYRVDQQKVYIDRILYGKRDFIHILFPDM
ncbi:type II toxin-antitoxin system RelE/ParE family toxin [[Clostridium] polysaccharolyticum]|uniref:Addiction module toxin, RelE/StbE family n=1 Tax=[Clostridium] polysaccharolyticum TaxID=29364 RepID=A0A1H9Y9G8_9FIRM|nr:type II toxin-antitoxin system RelE/ParE family toxin [[Clostridium] polysaccharolyticum]SES65575.1 addiction module toxin, RelE/StbE family [[Clostridium] polysaccharolyticum]